MKTPFRWLLGITFLAGFFWLFPPFHVVALRQPQQTQEIGPAAFAAKFWQTQLLPAAARAVALDDVLKALARDPDGARRKFGHSPGLSSSSCFLVHASGNVTAVEKESIRISLGGTNAPVDLEAGLIFGNTVRDATGLLDASSYPNSQDFNEVSAQLNHIIETSVLPGLREKAVVGKAIQFTGCFELAEGESLSVLELIPLTISWP